MRLIYALLSAGLSQTAQAQTDPLPSFADCMAREQARFERSLEAAEDVVSVLGVSGVDYCGGVGIVGCDRGTGPIACQVRLAKEQQALRGKVLSELPAPGDSALYQQLYDLAHGSSAGPDCSGATAPMVAWCMAWEANAALRSAVLAWQFARASGQLSSAAEAGWADLPAPTRPQGRTDE